MVNQFINIKATVADSEDKSAEQTETMFKVFFKDVLALITQHFPAVKIVYLTENDAQHPEEIFISHTTPENKYEDKQTSSDPASVIISTDISNNKSCENNSGTPDCSSIPEALTKASSTKESIPEVIEEVEVLVIPVPEHNPRENEVPVVQLEIINSLNRIREINNFLDQMRPMMEELPKIRVELNDLTSKLLDGFRHG